MVSLLIFLIISCVVFYFCTLLIKTIPSKSSFVRWISFFPLVFFTTVSLNLFVSIIFGDLFPVPLITNLATGCTLPIVFMYCTYKIIPSHKIGFLRIFSILWIVMDVFEIIWSSDSNHGIFVWVVQIIMIVAGNYVIAEALKDVSVNKTECNDVDSSDNSQNLSSLDSN